MDRDTSRDDTPQGFIQTDEDAPEETREEKYDREEAEGNRRHELRETENWRCIFAAAVLIAQGQRSNAKKAFVTADEMVILRAEHREEVGLTE